MLGKFQSQFAEIMIHAPICGKKFITRRYSHCNHQTRYFTHTTDQIFTLNWQNTNSDFAEVEGRSVTHRGAFDVV